MISTNGANTGFYRHPLCDRRSGCDHSVMITALVSSGTERVSLADCTQVAACLSQFDLLRMQIVSKRVFEHVANLRDASLHKPLDTQRLASDGPEHAMRHLVTVK